MQGCTANKITIIKGNIQPDHHVRLLISATILLSIVQIMQYLKGRSSKKLQEEFPELRKQFLGQHMWATDYFCRKDGTVTNELIKKYIDEQNDGIDELFKGNTL